MGKEPSQLTSEIFQGTSLGGLKGTEVEQLHSKESAIHGSIVHILFEVSWIQQVDKDFAAFRQRKMEIAAHERKP